MDEETMDESPTKKPIHPVIYLALLHIVTSGFMYLIVRPSEFLGVVGSILFSFFFCAFFIIFTTHSTKEMRKMQTFLNNGEPVDRVIDRDLKVGSKKSIGMVIGTLIVFPLIVALTFPLFFWFSMPFVLAGVGLTIYMGRRRNEAIRVNAWNPDDDEDEIILEFSDKVFEIEIEDAAIRESVDQTQ